MKQLDKPEGVTWEEWLSLRAAGQVEFSFDMLASLCDAFTAHRILDILQYPRSSNSTLVHVEPLQFPTQRQAT